MPKLILKGLCEHHHANILHYLSDRNSGTLSAGCNRVTRISSPSANEPTDDRDADL